MKLRFALCTTAFGVALAAACSPAPETDGASAPAAGGAAAKRMPLPDCAEVKTEDAGADGWKHPDCRVMLTDTSKLALEARYTKAEDETTKIALAVVQTGDATVQTIEETMGNTFARVELQDVDKDGKDDILVPLETGMVNITWALWRQSADNKFVRVGEVTGVDLKNTDSGYLAVPARSSANEWDVAFFKMDGDAMNPIVTTTVTARGTPDKITGQDCELADDGGLAWTGLAQDAAEAKFCAEPVVADIFK
ncbi:MAG TPA: hypothetical protein VGO52_17735 [Hyphomonadaceae bacterium]|jgi:hypothetical protein|nr:hypothetical protein [Hyphomonadaceae bacterium]